MQAACIFAQNACYCPPSWNKFTSGTCYLKFCLISSSCNDFIRNSICTNNLCECGSGYYFDKSSLSCRTNPTPFSSGSSLWDILSEWYVLTGIFLISSIAIYCCCHSLCKKKSTRKLLDQQAIQQRRLYEQELMNREREYEIERRQRLYEEELQNQEFEFRRKQSFYSQPMIVQNQPPISIPTISVYTPQVSTFSSPSVQHFDHPPNYNQINSNSKS